jgi:peptidoglycan-associated lipoprotein
MNKDTIRRLAIALAGMAALGTAVGCARVKPEQLQTELTQLRAEYQAADEKLASDVDGVDTRVDSLSTRVDGLDQHLAAVDARTAKLETDLQALAADVDATVVRLENAITFNAPVHFDYDSASLREQDRPLLERFAEVVGGYYGESLITVEGFTDPAGSEDYNRELGERRAGAVKSFLVEQGLDEGRIRTVSYGEAADRQVNPGAQGPGEAGLPNRRVALVIETSGSQWDIAAADTANGSDS